VLAFSDVVPVDRNDRSLASALMPRACAHAPSLGELLSRWWPIFPSSVVMRRDALLSYGGFDPGFSRPGYEDPLLWLQVRRHGAFRYVDRPLLAYRLAPELERMERYTPGLALFAARVRRDFGAAGEPLLKEIVAAHMSILGYEGVTALAMGDWPRARRAFRCALRYSPGHWRSRLRLLRSYLPALLISGLSSPRRRRRWNAEGIEERETALS
jgi:hypothetical protein